MQFYVTEPITEILGKASLVICMRTNRINIISYTKHHVYKILCNSMQ